MTFDFFKSQIDRLKLRFGEKAFDPEFIRLLHKEVNPMSNQSFVHVVDVLIGSRPASRPPLLIDFREMRIKIEKEDFNKVVNGAVKTVYNPANHNGLKSYLAKEYPGCNSLWEAVEVERLRIKVKRAMEQPDDGGAK